MECKVDKEKAGAQSENLPGGSVPALYLPTAALLGFEGYTGSPRVANGTAVFPQTTRYTALTTSCY